MSNDPSGILAYGYDLGGPDGGWKLTVPEANEYGHLSKDKFVFMNPFDGCNESSFSERLRDYLLMTSGFKLYESGKPDRPQDYWKLKSEAEKGLGIVLEVYGSSDDRGYILATTVFTSPDYEAMEVRPDIIDHSAADRLYRALINLKIWPKQPEPRWILASYYG